MAKKKKELSDDGIPLKSGLEVYAEVEIANGVMILVSITMEDENGNAHNVLRRDLDNTLTDGEL
jgi:hypothetical protein